MSLTPRRGRVCPPRGPWNDRMNMMTNGKYSTSRTNTIHAQRTIFVARVGLTVFPRFSRSSCRSPFSDLPDVDEAEHERNHRKGDHDQEHRDGRRLGEVEDVDLGLDELRKHRVLRPSDRPLREE